MPLKGDKINIHVNDLSRVLSQHLFTFIRDNASIDWGMSYNPEQLLEASTPEKIEIVESASGDLFFLNRSSPGEIQISTTDLDNDVSNFKRRLEDISYESGLDMPLELGIVAD